MTMIPKIPRTITIVSFGFGHPGGVPDATLVVDLRTHFRDPHVSPALRVMTARDTQVRAAVVSTPGICPLVTGLVAAVGAYLEAPAGTDITVVIGCTGGRHRAPTVALMLARRIERNGHPVKLVHRDMDKAVIAR